MTEPVFKPSGQYVMVPAEVLGDAEAFSFSDVARGMFADYAKAMADEIRKPLWFDPGRPHAPADNRPVYGPRNPFYSVDLGGDLYVRWEGGRFFLDSGGYESETAIYTEDEMRDFCAKMLAFIDRKMYP